MSQSEKDSNPVEPTLEPLLQAHIGKQLRMMYDAMAREPVPERFKLLLDQLEAGENPQGQQDGQENGLENGRENDHIKAGADKAGAA